MSPNKRDAEHAPYRHRATGPGLCANLADPGAHQTLINAALCEYVEQQHKPLEEALLLVVREELQKAA